MITYKTDKIFQEDQLKALFASVNWLSANYSQRLVKALASSDTVISAWDDGHLAGLVNAIDDGELTAYAHYLLVDPAYQNKGIGKTLVAKLKEKYEGYLYLVLTAENEGLVSFYRKNGFEAADGAVPMMIKTL